MKPPVLQVQPKIEREDAIEVGKYLSFLYEYRWLIAGIALLGVLTGIAYVVVAEPTYESNILIQVEDLNAGSNTGSPKNIQSDLSTAFDIKTATASEMEILKSRAVVSRAVDHSRLYISVQPKRFLGIGTWISRYNHSLSDPGLLGYGGYVWGAEHADVSLFNVPERIEGHPFTLTVIDKDNYRLTRSDDDLDLTGRVGDTLRLHTHAGDATLRVDRLLAKPGAQFMLTRHARLETIERLQSRLKISENRKESGIISVSLEGPDPQLTSSTLNQIGLEYVRLNVDRKSEKAQKSLAFLDKQLPDLKERLERSENNYKEFRNKHKTFDLASESRAMLDQSVWIQTRITELNQKRIALQVRYQDEHPEIRQLSRQINTLTRQLDGLNERIAELPAIEQTILRLNRDVKVNTDLYTSLLATAQQLRLVTSSEVGNARLLDAAAIPIKPIRPKPFLAVLLAGASGLFFGLIAAFLKKNLYGRVGSPQEIEQALGLPVAGTIPYSEAQDKAYARLPNGAGGAARVTSLPHSVASDCAMESLHRLRTTMEFAMHSSVNNIIMVTGPTPGVGKSFVSANYASVLASFDKRVLLIDGDVRSGSLHRSFGLPRKGGLSDAIASPALFERIIHKDVMENVDFVSTGTLAEKPGRLLAHPNLGKLLETWSARYDFVLIDTAPVLAVSDALVVASHAGIILNIVRGGLSTMDEIEEAVKQLNQAGRTVTGVVFNDLRTRFGRYGFLTRYGKYPYAASHA